MAKARLQLSAQYTEYVQSFKYIKPVDTRMNRHTRYRYQSYVECLIKTLKHRKLPCTKIENATISQTAQVLMTNY